MPPVSSVSVPRANLMDSQCHWGLVIYSASFEGTRNSLLLVLYSSIVLHFICCGFSSQVVTSGQEWPSICTVQLYWCFCNPLGLSKFFVLCKCKEITVWIRKCLYYGKGSILFPGMFGYPFQEPDRRSWVTCMSCVLDLNLGRRGRSFRPMQSLYSSDWGSLYPDGASAMLTTNIHLVLVWRICGAAPAVAEIGHLS